MPEGRHPELEGVSQVVEDIYIDSELLGKFWFDDCKSYFGKPAKGALGTFIFNDCDEKVILLMGSDCDPEDLMMGGLVLSKNKDEISSDCEDITGSVVLGDELNVEPCVREPSDGDDHGEKHEKSQDVAKETKMTGSREENSSEYDHNSGLDDQEMEYILPYRNEFHGEAQDNFSMVEQYSGPLPYSGSISLRSTSSTASNQSFAFPVMTHELGSSPVRMPRPEKRQLRKQKHSRRKLFWVCCKF